MRRLTLLVAPAILIASASHAATRTYSTGALHQLTPAGAAVEQGIRVRDHGPISRVEVGFRLDHRADGELKISLVSPEGTEVALVAHKGGKGANFGTGKGCDGRLVYFADDGLSRLDEARAPFTGFYQYVPEQRLSRLNGEEAAGKWRLRIDDAGGTRAGVLRCFTLDVSRNIVERRTVSAGGVEAQLSFRERNFSYSHVRLRILRRGRTVLDSPFSRLACRGCPLDRLAFVNDRPIAVRDLDGDGEPEVLVDGYTGGAHCCSYTVILRYLPVERRYVHVGAFWGNAGYDLGDLDRDGQPELVSTDDRFAYTFAAYAATVEPGRIWRFEQGRLVDVTRSFPRTIAAEAAGLWRSYLKQRRERGAEVRSLLAAWAADMALLDRVDEAWTRLDEANRRGDLGSGRDSGGWPGGRFYLDKLRIVLRQWDYTG